MSTDGGITEAMVEADKGDLRTVASGLFPSGFDAAALTPQGRDEVRAAVDVILKLWDYGNARVTLALEQLDKAAAEIERLQATLAAQKGEGVREGLSGDARVALSNAIKGRLMVYEHYDERPHGAALMAMDIIQEAIDPFLKTLAASPIPTAWNKAVEAQLTAIWSQIENGEFGDIEDDEDFVVVTIKAKQARAIRRALTCPKPAPEENNNA